MENYQPELPTHGEPDERWHERVDSSLESIAAEFLPVAQMLVEIGGALVDANEDDYAEIYRGILDEGYKAFGSLKKDWGNLRRKMLNAAQGELAAIQGGLSNVGIVGEVGIPSNGHVEGQLPEGPAPLPVAPPLEPPLGRKIVQVWCKENADGSFSSQCIEVTHPSATPPGIRPPWFLAGVGSSFAECERIAAAVCGKKLKPPAKSPPVPEPPISGPGLPEPFPGLCPLPGPVEPGCPAPPKVPIQILPGPVPWPLPPPKPPVDPPVIIIMPLPGPGQTPIPPFPWPIGVPFPWPGYPEPAPPGPPGGGAPEPVPPAPGPAPEPPGGDDKCKVDVQLNLAKDVDWSVLPDELKQKLIECGWKLPTECGFSSSGEKTYGGEDEACSPDVKDRSFLPKPLYADISARLLLGLN